MFRPDAVIALLRKAYKDSNLRTVCKLVLHLCLVSTVVADCQPQRCQLVFYGSIFLFQASRIMQKLIEPAAVQEAADPSSEGMSSVFDESSKSEVFTPALLVDYSNLFGDEFQIPDDGWESNYLNVLDIGAVEEGLLHILYGCASQVGYIVRDGLCPKNPLYLLHLDTFFVLTTLIQKIIFLLHLLNSHNCAASWQVAL